MVPARKGASSRPHAICSPSEGRRKSWHSRSSCPGWAGTWRRARVGEWLKRDGDRVEAGEIIFTVRETRPRRKSRPWTAASSASRQARRRRAKKSRSEHSSHISSPRRAAAVRRRRRGDPGCIPGRDRWSIRAAVQSAPASPLAGRACRTRHAARPSARAPGVSRASWASTGRASPAPGRTGRIVERDVRGAAQAAQAAPPAGSRGQWGARQPAGTPACGGTRGGCRPVRGPHAGQEDRAG